MQTEIERANEDLVNRFCRDWSKQDAELLTGYFAEPFEYMVWEGGPVITTSEAFIKQMGPFLKKLKAVDWVVVRSHALGPMVINERIDELQARVDHVTRHYDDGRRISDPGMLWIRRELVNNRIQGRSLRVPWMSE